jgi:hypothetical protein
MRSIKEQLSTTIVFEGLDVQATLEDSPRMYEAVWKAAGQYANSNIRINVSRPLDDFTEWTMTVASPTGRTTHAFVQHNNGPVHLSRAAI